MMVFADSEQEAISKHPEFEQFGKNPNLKEITCRQLDDRPNVWSVEARYYRDLPLPACRTCQWWDRSIDIIQGEKVVADIHQCKRMPPRQGEGLALQWPMTGADDWCGEHTERRVQG